MTDLGRRFVACFEGALDDAAFPAEVRPVLSDYIRWAVDDVLSHEESAPDGLPMPHWSWDGLTA